MPKVPLSFLIASISFTVFLGIYFLIRKKYILNHYKQPDSKELKSINGMIITERGFLRKNFQWCSFDMLINDNSIFLFPKAFYFIPSSIINLIFSNSKKENTKRPTLLREFKISRNNIELIYYPDYLITGKRRILLNNLKPEQFSLLEEILTHKSRRIY